MSRSVSLLRRPARIRLAIGASLLVSLLQPVQGLAQGGPAGSGHPPPDLNRPADSPAAGVTLDKLFTSLDLQPAQMDAWRVYAGRVDAYLQLFYRQQPVQATDSAPRQLARVVDRLQNQLASIEEIERAVRGLYQVLTPDQRRQADAMLLATLPSGLLGTASAPTGDMSSTPRSGPAGRGSAGGGPPGGAGGGPGGF